MRAGFACVVWLLPLAGLTACGQVGTNVLSQPGTPSAVAPSITAQPTDQSIKVGDAATFSVVAAGSVPPSHQWHKNGAATAGAAATSYTTPPPAPRHDADTPPAITSKSVRAAATSTTPHSATP